MNPLPGSICLIFLTSVFTKCRQTCAGVIRFNLISLEGNINRKSHGKRTTNCFILPAKCLQQFHLRCQHSSWNSHPCKTHQFPAETLEFHLKAPSQLFKYEDKELVKWKDNELHSCSYSMQITKPHSIESGQY